MDTNGGAETKFHDTVSAARGFFGRERTQEAQRVPASINALLRVVEQARGQVHVFVKDANHAGFAARKFSEKNEVAPVLDEKDPVNRPVF
jgi:hypothetical protein